MNSKEKYREFCKKEKMLPIFLMDWWLDSVCGIDNWDVLIYEKKNNILGVFPYVIKRKYCFRAIGMPKLTQVLGPYLLYPVNQKYDKKLSFEKEVFNFFIKNLPKHGIFKQNFNYNVNNWLPFYWEKFLQTTKYTYLIEGISNLDKIYENINSKYRNKIRKAEKKLIVSSDMDIESFYILHEKVYKRQNLEVPYSKEFLIKHDKILSRNNARKIFKAVDSDGQIHSSIYLTWITDLLIYT